METTAKTLRAEADRLRAEADKLQRMAKLAEQLANEYEDDATPQRSEPQKKAATEPSVRGGDRLEAVTTLIRSNGGAMAYSDILATDLVPRGSLSAFLKKHFVSIEGKWTVKE